MKLQNLSSKEKIYINLEENSDKVHSKDMSDNMKYDEREQINNNEEVKVSDIVEDLKLGKLSLHKYVDNVGTESDKKILVDMSDEKDSIEIYEIQKNDDGTQTNVGEESDEIQKINRKEQYGLESEKSETDGRYQIEISDLLKRIDSKKNDMMMIQLILILIKRQMMKNQSDYPG